MTTYAHSFESSRRVNPRLWDSDYALLRGTAADVRRFASACSDKGATVLDFGCGAKPYRNLFPRGCHYAGIDTHGNPHADIADNVPLADGYADLLISTQVVYLIPDLEDRISPRGTAMAAPVILCATARPV